MSFLTVVDTNGDEIFNMSGEGLYIPLPADDDIITLQIVDDDDNISYTKFRVLGHHLSYSRYNCDPTATKADGMWMTTEITLVVEPHDE